MVSKLVQIQIFFHSSQPLYILLATFCYLTFCHAETCPEFTTTSSEQANIYPWGELPSGTTEITFKVKTQDNAHIGLATAADDSTVLAEVGR